MSGTRPVLCIAMMLLLGVACSNELCNYSMLLETYSKLILVELQSLNMTGLFDTPTESDCCPSNKVTRIVRSIYGMTVHFKSLSQGLPEDSLVAVVSRMDQVIQLYCKKRAMKNTWKARSCRTVQRKKGRRLRRIRTIQMLKHCWQKLQKVPSRELFLRSRLPRARPLSNHFEVQTHRCQVYKHSVL